MFETRHLVRN